MHNDIVSLNIIQFSLIYLLLLVVTIIMKKCGINKQKLLFIASFRMSIQLVITGFILTYIFKHPSWMFTTLYLLVILIFTIYNVIKKYPQINKKFKKIIALSISLSGLSVLSFFILIVVRENFFNPQYAIPIFGMLMGNSMTGVSLAIKTFVESLVGKQEEIDGLLGLGIHPDSILLPHIKQAIATAILPTMNNMIGMGIISLPGMMTGQILSGTLPMTAILYQIAIMIAICTVVTCASFICVYFGSKTLYTFDKCIISVK